DWRDLPHLFQTSAAARRRRDLGGPRRVRLSSRLGRTLSAAGRDAGADEERRLRRSDMDSLHFRCRRSLSREEIGVAKLNCNVGTAEGGCPHILTFQHCYIPSLLRAAVCLTPRCRRGRRLPPQNIAARAASSYSY